MVIVKTGPEIDLMRKAGAVTAEALRAGIRAARPGVSTWELNRVVEETIRSLGAVPSFKGLYGFPAAACISVNEELIHGIPDRKRILREGDIVSIDTGACVRGFHGDSAYTTAVGEIPPEVRKLLDVTKECLRLGIAEAKAGNRLGDIGQAIETCAESFGYGVVRDYVGHGIGRSMHEDPEVPNYGRAGRGVRLVPGMTIAIEPMINMKGAGVRVSDNGWTVIARSGLPSAHFEHSIAVTEDGPVILTAPPDGP